VAPIAAAAPRLHWSTVRLASNPGHGAASEVLAGQPALESAFGRCRGPPAHVASHNDRAILREFSGASTEFTQRDVSPPREIAHSATSSGSRTSRMKICSPSLNRARRFVGLGFSVGTFHSNRPGSLSLPQSNGAF